MAKAEIKQQSSHRRQNRFLLLLLAGATFLSAAKDVIRLHDFASGVVGLATSVHQTVNAAVTSPEDTSCPQALAENDNSAQPFYWNGRVAPDQLMNISDSSGGVDAVPAVGVHLGIALNQASHGQAAASIQVVAPATEVATALPPGEYSSLPRGGGRSRIATRPVMIGVRGNDHQTRLSVPGPSAIALVDGTVNDEVSAYWLSSDLLSSAVCPIAMPRIDAPFVNDRSSISLGYTQAQILSRASNTGLTEANCTEASKFKTARRIVSLDLLQLLKANVETERLNGDTVSDVPRTLRVVIQRTMSAAAAEEAH